MLPPVLFMVKDDHIFPFLQKVLNPLRTVCNNKRVLQINFVQISPVRSSTIP